MVKHTAKVAGQHPQAAAHDTAGQDGEKGDAEGIASAVHNAAENVAAQLVGTQDILPGTGRAHLDLDTVDVQVLGAAPRGWSQAFPWVDVIGIVGSQPLGGNCRKNQQDHQDKHGYQRVPARLGDELVDSAFRRNDGRNAGDSGNVHSCSWNYELLIDNSQLIQA